jgi:predicted metal-dependent enzyme (double-stranded beta helix superfamily)
MSLAIDTLETFIDDIEALVARERTPRKVVAGVQARLPFLLARPDFLPPRYRQPDPEHYRTHLLAVAPSKKFSIMSMVWLPGQMTPIHDHICWCVVGVLQGVECEQRYSLRERPDGKRWLAPVGEDDLYPCQVAGLVPPEENIHQVWNGGQDIAISIHIYGEDLSVYGSSINQRFDDLPICYDDTSGSPVAWRRELAG